MSVGFVVISGGLVERAGLCQQADVAAQAVNAGEVAHEVPATVIALPDLNAEPLKALLWEKVKARRTAMIDGGAPTPFGIVDSDASARSNITAAALAAVIAQSAGAPFSVDWTLFDNSVATLDSAQMIAMGLAVLAHVDAWYRWAQILRGQISDGSDIAELLAINVESGPV